MGRGGKRNGAGRKPGQKNAPKFQLQLQAEADGKAVTPALRHALMKKQVALCVADGMTPCAIAAVLLMPLDQLQALFVRELTHGREIVRAELLARLDAQSDGGNVAAGKEVLRVSDGEAASSGRNDDQPGGSLHARAIRVINGGKQ